MPPSPLVPPDSKHRPLLRIDRFARRVGITTLASLTLIAVSLAGGMCGYHFLEHMLWIDAFANAAMILSGMGPLMCPQSFGGKLFAGLYALYSGLVLIIAAGIILTPIVHRLMHRFHLEESES